MSAGGANDGGWTGTAEKDGERVVERFGSVRVDEATSLKFPRFWGERLRRLRLLVLRRPASARCSDASRAHHSPPDTESVRPRDANDCNAGLSGRCR